MDKGKSKTLNRYHVIFLVHQAMLGAGLLSLPHFLSPSGYNQWWVVLLMGGIAQGTLLPIYWLCSRYPGDDLFAIQRKLLGKWLGQVCNAALIAYLVLMISGQLFFYARLVQNFAQPERSMNLTMFILLLVTLYIVAGGIKLIARFAIITFFFVIWMMYFLRWPLQKGVMSHLLPLVDVSWMEIIAALQKGYYNMLGYELLLFYFPYIIRPRKVLFDASIAIWSLVVIYTVISLVSVLYFSRWQLEHLTYPILNLLRAVELTFMERIENLGITMWGFLVLSTLAVYLWGAKKGMDAIFSRNRSGHLYLVAIMCYALLVLPLPTQFQLRLFFQWAVYAGYGVVVWPIFLLIVHAIRNPKGRSA